MAMLRTIALAAALLATSVKSEPLFGWLLPWNTDNSTTESPDTSTVEPVFKTSDYVPYLTEEDFARAELVDDRALAESLSDDDNGGPLMSNGTLDEIDNRYWQLWKNGEIPYTLAKGFGPNDRAQIAKAVKYLERVSCLRFKGVGFDAPKKPRMDFIAASGSTCYCSWSGGKKINAQINLGERGGCRVPRTIAHEILHGIGMYHTHMRPDRDDFVTINFNNIKSGMEKEFKKCPNGNGKKCDTYGSPYDCESVMHYASNQMGKGGKTTITPKKASCKLLPFKQWNAKSEYLSSKDIAYLKRQYPSC